MFQESGFPKLPDEQRKALATCVVKRFRNAKCATEPELKPPADSTTEDDAPRSVKALPASCKAQQPRSRLEVAREDRLAQGCHRDSGTLAQHGSARRPMGEVHVKK